MIKFIKIEDTPEKVKDIIKSLNMKYLLNEVRYLYENDKPHVIAKVSGDSELRDAFYMKYMKKFSAKDKYVKFFKEDKTTSHFVYVSMTDNNMKLHHIFPPHCEGLYFLNMRIKGEYLYIRTLDSYTKLKFKLKINLTDLNTLIYKRTYLMKYMEA